jgi:hypothetical protein
MSGHRRDLADRYPSLAALFTATDNPGEPPNWQPVAVHDRATGTQVQITAPRIGTVALALFTSDLDAPRFAIEVELTTAQARAVCIALAQVIEHQESMLKGDAG